MSHAKRRVQISGSSKESHVVRYPIPLSMNPSEASPCLLCTCFWGKAASTNERRPSQAEDVAHGARSKNEGYARLPMFTSHGRNNAPSTSAMATLRARSAPPAATMPYPCRAAQRRHAHAHPAHLHAGLASTSQRRHGVCRTNCSRHQSVRPRAHYRRASDSIGMPLPSCTAAQTEYVQTDTRTMHWRDAGMRKPSCGPSRHAGGVSSGLRATNPASAGQQTLSLCSSRTP